MELGGSGDLLSPEQVPNGAKGAASLAPQTPSNQGTAHTCATQPLHKLDSCWIPANEAQQADIAGVDHPNPSSELCGDTPGGLKNPTTHPVETTVDPNLCVDNGVTVAGAGGGEAYEAALMEHVT